MLITVRSQHAIRFFWGTHDRLGNKRKSFPPYVTASVKTWIRWGLEPSHKVSSPKRSRPERGEPSGLL